MEMQSLTLGDIATTPWAIHPIWFAGIAIAMVAAVWLALAWHRALSECPNRVRRTGVRDMRRLLREMQRSGPTPQPAQLQAWLGAAARVWDVRTSAPTDSEVLQAAQSISGDGTVSRRWFELWRATEHRLYGRDGVLPADWVAQTSMAAAEIPTPRRERLFPNRIAHWLPSIAVALAATLSITPTASDADVPLSSPEPVEETPSAETPELIPGEVRQAAQSALDTNWNDWAAHHNLAAYGTQGGEINLAIAHATAAFIQHPSSTSRETLNAALGETPLIDENLGPLLNGAWYERAPALLSAAAWQRLALASALLATIGFGACVFVRYVPRVPATLPWTARTVAAVGSILLLGSIAGWNGYGALAQPHAAILLQSVNVSPVPTDLVPAEETSPLSAGSIVLTQRTFLGWQQVSSGRVLSGWIRGNAVMPLYAQR